MWREYMRIRVTFDLTKSLKRKMKVKKVWWRLVMDYIKIRKVPTFCFICGLVGHSENFAVDSLIRLKRI